MTQPTFNFPIPNDICSHRHKGNAESVAANPAKISKIAMHETIITLLLSRSMTGKEIAATIGVPFNCISGRFTELKDLERIKPTGVKREGSMELEIVK